MFGKYSAWPNAGIHPDCRMICEFNDILQSSINSDPHQHPNACPTLVSVIAM
jgi:hypothetical protein